MDESFSENSQNNIYFIHYFKNLKQFLCNTANKTVEVHFVSFEFVSVEMLFFLYFEGMSRVSLE